MRSGIARQNSDMHAHSVFSQPKEPLHRRACEMRAARSRIDSGANSSAHHATRTIHKVAVQARMVIRVFLKHVHLACGRLVSAFAGCNWTIGHEFVPDHVVSPAL